MFDIGTKIKHAWNTIWHYKVLWIFVFLMALTGAGGGGGGGNSGSSFSSSARNTVGNGSLNMVMPAWMTEMGSWMEQNIGPLFTPDRVVGTVIWMVAIILLFSLLVSALMALVRYPAETAVIRLVDDYEATGNKVKFKQGWKLGWNRRAFRLWVIDLIIGAPAFLLIASLITGATIFFINFANKEMVSQIPGMIGAIILIGLLFFSLSIVMIFVGLWRQFVVRSAALEDTGIGESFKNGWKMMTHNFKNAFLTWLVMLGIGIGFGFASIFAMIILIPAFAVLAIPGAVVGAIPAAIAYGISTIFTSGPLVWVITALVAIPFFFTVVFAPLTLWSSLYMLFESSIWTQTYREMKAGSVPPVLPIPEVTEPPSLPAA